MNISRKEASAALCVCSTTITAKEIKSILNVTLDRSCEKGDLISKKALSLVT